MAEALPDLTGLARLSYETSLRTLSLQEASLNELRARTGTLVAAASLATSFLGGAAFTRNRRLAYWLDGFHDDNEPKINELFVIYRWATGFLLLEVVFWSIQLALS